ncbi:hypothetical protein [Cecembia rubra]|uniref:Nucleotide-binding universal stress UspA family protein n=1 Tax=Cecembia rubra TaxID=1485585 RepID=A0A2P8ECK6_9BACT|nr:hypothetical protein [Cecembia rubra]PSL07206.1 hypothetical protein CLV48_101136 [Cecembia rubra]
MKSNSGEKPKLWVLVDFSDYSKKVLQVARRWSENLELEVQVFHELDFQVPTLANHELRLKMKYGHIHEINRTWLRMKKLIFGEEARIGFEILEEPIIEFLKKNHPSVPAFILMGLKGGGLLKQVFLGSMVNEVVEKINQITVAVPKHLHEFQPKKIVISVHPKYELNLKELERLLFYLPNTVTSIQWISIAMENDKVEELNDYLVAISKKVDTNLMVETAVFSGEDLFTKLKSFVSGDNSQILVVQRGSRTFKDKLFRKFLVNELVYDGSIPLIILPF